MPLPTSRELREMLEYASPYPWRREGGFIRPARENATWSIAAIEDEGGQIGADDDCYITISHVYPLERVAEAPRGTEGAE